MEKTAQRRGLLHRIRENVDIGGHAAEMVSPTFGKLMDQMRETDDKIRDLIIESDARLKDILKSAKSNFNRREYMAAVSDLTRFHEKVASIINILRVFNVKVDEAHEEFVFGKDLPGDTIKGLRGLKDRFETKSSAKSELSKQAGISDLWHILTSERGKALRAWEKRYPEKMRDLKNQTNSLIVRSEQLFEVLLTSLKEMSSARSRRKLDEYIKAGERVTSKYNDYDRYFAEYYNKNVKGFLDKLMKAEVEQAAKIKEMEDLKKEVESIKTPVSRQFPAAPSFAPSTTMSPSQYSSDPATQKNQVGLDLPPMSSNVPSVRPTSNVSQTYPVTQRSPTFSPSTQTSPGIPSAPKENKDVYEKVQYGKVPQPPIPRDFAQEAVKTVAPQKPKSPTVIVPPGSEDEGDIGSNPTVRSNYLAFVSSLQSLSSEDPMFLALQIKKFANKIKESDPQTSLKLIAIVEGIVDGD